MNLEISCYSEAIDEEAKADRLQRSSTARANLTSAAYSREEEVRTHLVNQNTAQAGLITWMKPDVNFHINPRPINLLEALSYLMERDSYESTGTEVLDFFSYDVDVQFEIIKKIIFVSNECTLQEERKTR